MSSDAIDESPENTDTDDIFEKDPITKRRIKDDAHLIPTEEDKKQKTYGSLPVNPEVVDSKVCRCFRL